MRYLTLLVVVTMTGFMTSCSGLRTWSDATAGVDFEKYQTYMIDDECSEYNPGVNPIHQQRIKNAIEMEMRSLGYERSEEADINIKFYVKNETEYFYENCANDYSGYDGGELCVEKAYAYEVGTLAIDFFDRQENKAIWHAGAKGKSWQSLDNPDSVISSMVKSLFKEYQKVSSGSSYASR